MGGRGKRRGRGAEEVERGTEEKSGRETVHPPCATGYLLFLMAVAIVRLPDRKTMYACARRRTQKRSQLCQAPSTRCADHFERMMLHQAIADRIVNKLIFLMITRSSNWFGHYVTLQL